MLLRHEGLNPEGIPQYANVGLATGADDIKDARGMAVADFDNDGDLDIVVNTNPGDHGETEVRPVLLRNDVGHNRSWLILQLVGEQSNTDALGAEVRIRAGDLQAMRHVHSGSGYASQSDARLFFGLNNNMVVDSIDVKWPSGKTQTFHNVGARQRLVLHEGGSLKTWELPGRAEGKVVQTSSE